MNGDDTWKKVTHIDHGNWYRLFVDGPGGPLPLRGAEEMLSWHDGFAPQEDVLWVESGSMKNERYALREWTLIDTKPSALPPGYLIIEDRHQITLGRVTHSNRGGSLRHCVATDVIWEDYGWYTVRWLVLSLACLCQMLHILTCFHHGPRRSAVIPGGLLLWTSICCRLKEWVWLSTPSHPLMTPHRRKA